MVFLNLTADLYLTLPDNMNWAIVLIAGVILVVFIDWVLRARHHYYYGN